MTDPRFASAQTMSTNIRMDNRERYNPMDLTSVLNPLHTPPSSDSEEYWSEPDEQVHSSFSRDSSYSVVPQPMEVDGEVPTNSTNWDHHESSLPTLPPMQLVPESLRFPNLAYRPAQGIPMTQNIQRRSENDLGRRYNRPGSHSPPRRQDRHGRRGSYPHLSTPLHRPRISLSPSSSSESSLEADEETVHWMQQKKRKRKRKRTGPHSNKPYTQEQIHWLRYHAEDCGLNYAQMYNLWAIHFPNDPRVPGQAFCSRLYRDNISAMVDDDDNLIRDSDGKPIIIVINIRKRQQSKFKHFPFKFWEKNPEWALYWDWVMPEHKAMAQKILDGRDLDASQLLKEKSRRAIRKYEAEAPARKGWFATPALHAASVLKAKSKGEAKNIGLSPSPEWTSMVIKPESEQTSDRARKYDHDSQVRRT
ncbi:hypothetical protein BKA61DRAFT_610498 [Leptodontidium sp. MPI-SDFR-AT-0119]|nr:hypothetical protein BKA61DRAFT_610498 [Leptodontidium sp. MPI-SDFR-AT-0119]